MVSRISVLLVICFVIVLDRRLWAYASMFSAVAQLASLLATHKIITNDIDDYVFSENMRLDIIEKYLNMFMVKHKKTIDENGYHFRNTINTFTLIKRLIKDKDFIEILVEARIEYKQKKDLKYPTNKDVHGAALGLGRLQRTYHLNITQLASGTLNGYFSRDKHRIYTENFTPMAASDCYVIGRSLNQEKRYQDAVGWLIEAFYKYREGKREAFNLTDVDILVHISKSYHSLDDVTNTLLWTKRLVAMKNNNSRISGRRFIEQYQNRIAREEMQKSQKEDVSIPKHRIVNPKRALETFNALCRGDFDNKKQIAKRLKCRYLSDSHLFLKIAPLKIEHLYSNPDLILIHDVLTNDEIKYIKKIAKPKLHRAKAEHLGKSFPVKFRICKTTWIKDNESEIVAKISRRISHFTGLAMETAEPLQLANYGIGGHYDPHCDFISTKNVGMPAYQENRIATVLFYMSDVTLGGGTAFTKLGIHVFPLKKAALFWMNLKQSGKGDPLTMHGACPVLRGSKWVATKWIRVAGQELLRPCHQYY